MAFGVHLGILLICLVQAEHARCLWAKQAQSSQRQNGNAYVGFSQQQSGQGRLASNYPQNQLRLASAQSRSFNAEPAASSSRFSQVYSSGGDTNPYSQPAQSGRSSVRLVQSSLLSNPNWRLAKSNHANAQNVPKNSFGLSTAIASGRSVSQHKKKGNDFTNVSTKRTWPVQQGAAHVRKYVSSTSAAVQSPRSLSAAQGAPSAAAAASVGYGPQSYAPVKSPSRFSMGAPALQEMPVQMQTSATARARKVSSHRSSEPSRFSPPQNERSVNNPSQAAAGNRYQSKLFQPTGGNARGSQSLPVSQKQNALNFQPRSYTSSESSGTGASGQRFAPTRTYNIPDRFGGFAIRRLKEPADQKVSVRKPQQSYPTYSWQSASLQRQQQQTHPALQRQQQQTHPALQRQQQQTHPALQRQQQQTHPALQRQQQQTHPALQRQQQEAYQAPPQQQAYKPQVQSPHPESKWKRVRPSGRLSAAGITG